VCVRVCECVRARVHVYEDTDLVHLGVCACMCEHVCVCAYVSACVRARTYMKTLI